MPKGIETSAHRPKHHEWGAIPFVLLSAESSVESKIRGLDSGADAYIEKPFSISHFKAVIDSIINNRRVLMEKFASSPEESLNFSKYGTLDIEWLLSLLHSW